MSQHELKTIIEETYADSQSGAELKAPQIQSIHQLIEELNSGKVRVAQKHQGEWQTNEYVKKAILLYFKIMKMVPMNAGDFSYYDKIPTKKWNGTEGVRVVPHAIARYGSFISAGAILMPSYVNIGAYVGTGTMVDTWATVGSCAQIGAHVHLSGGVGIGGVLEPIQASPVIIEDHCFIGSRSIIVEGAVIEEGAVIGAGVTITGSTKIIDVTDSVPKFFQGRVPKNSVVIPGTFDKKYPAGNFGVPCALIIGQRKASTDLKTSLTEALRDHGVSV